MSKLDDVQGTFIYGVIMESISGLDYDQAALKIQEWHDAEIKKSERHARMNEHHVLSRMMSNDDLRLVPNLVAAFKRRFAELKGDKNV